MFKIKGQINTAIVALKNATVHKLREPRVNPPRVVLPKTARHIIRTGKMWSLQQVNARLSKVLQDLAITPEIWRTCKPYFIAADAQVVRIEMNGVKDEELVYLTITISGQKDWPIVEIKVT
jgi:hypothetical protein